MKILKNCIFLLFMMFVAGCDKPIKFTGFIYSIKNTYSEGQTCELLALNKNADGVDINDCTISWKKANGDLPYNNSIEGNKIILRHLLQSDAGTYNASISDKSGHLVSNASIDIKVETYTGTAPCVIAANAINRSGNLIDGYPANDTFLTITVDEYGGRVFAELYSSTYQLYIIFNPGNFTNSKPIPGIYPIAKWVNYSTEAPDGYVLINYYSNNPGTYSYAAQNGQVYVTRENGNLYLTLCSVSFSTSSNQTQNITAKIPL